MDANPATAHETVPAQQVVDPVCGMTIDPADAVGHAEYEGKTYYFCRSAAWRSSPPWPHRWMFHCHHAYHMEARMARIVEYA